MAKLYFIFGAMGSTKTLRLLTTAYNFEEKKIPFIVFKPSLDTRDGMGIIKSRVGFQRECISIDQDVDLYETMKQMDSVLAAQGYVTPRWVLIDECQFLTVKQVDELSDIVDFMDVNVMCYGLRTDFQSKLFPASQRLFEIADNFEEVHSSCQCGNKASINCRFDKDGNMVTEGEQVLVGGNDVYTPLCRKCWKEKKMEQKKNNTNEN